MFASIYSGNSRARPTSSECQTLTARCWDSTIYSSTCCTFKIRFKFARWTRSAALMPTTHRTGQTNTRIKPCELSSCDVVISGRDSVSAAWFQFTSQMKIQSVSTRADGKTRRCSRVLPKNRGSRRDFRQRCNANARKTWQLQFRLQHETAAELCLSQINLGSWGFCRLVLHQTSCMEIKNDDSLSVKVWEMICSSCFLCVNWRNVFISCIILDVSKRCGS